jgi:hypothetical protein
VSVVEDKVFSWCILDLPHVYRLAPKDVHSSHTLYDGKLLEPAGVFSEGGKMWVNVCGGCCGSLSKATPDLPPPLSLANDMWIGNIPTELDSLTFPEQLLLAHLYPRVYVFKLYPKKGFASDLKGLQQGMRGTVSTFALDLAGITSMIEGKLMPRPTFILAALISVTFIGLGHLPKNWIRQLFRVCRYKVLEALRWLKTHNPKYYGDVVIDDTRIGLLPDDDVPIELLSVIRQSTDVDVVMQESAGYVEEDNIVVNEWIAEDDGEFCLTMAVQRSRMIDWWMNDRWES